ncbi:MAG TPA: hypothetical protein VGP72_28390 [Planctomycetota bacterium]|jgi:hypothetical protein
MRNLRLLACWLAASACVAAVAAETELPFERQLYELGYQIYHTSAINLIQGLNLSADQITKLRALTVKIEQSAPKPPICAGNFAGKLGPVRQTYDELGRELLKGPDVPKALEARVGAARMTESSEIRASLHKGVNGKGCATCHVAPGDRGSDLQAHDLSHFDQRAVFMGHMTGLYGLLGTYNLAKESNEIPKILSDSQMALVGQFSCCLVPPQDLKDPARVGQAAVSEQKLQLLKGVRAIPESAWGFSKKIIEKKAEDLYIAISPGISNADRSTEAQRAMGVLEKTRKLSDVEFELQKEALARELDRKQTPTANDSHKNFYAAMFLLLPGNTALYDLQLQKLKQQPVAAAQKTDLNKIQGADHCENGQCALKDGGNLQPGAGKPKDGKQ